MAVSDIQTGALALVYGAPSFDLKINGGTTLTFAAGYVLTDVSVSRTADQIETRNAAGDIVNVTTYNAGDEVTLTVKPAGTTRANAKTVADTFPRPGGYAALIDATDITHLDNAAISGTIGGVSLASSGVSYMIKSATKNSTPGQAVTWTLVLQRHSGITTYTPLS